MNHCTEADHSTNVYETVTTACRNVATLTADSHKWERAGMSSADSMSYLITLGGLEN